MVFEKLQIKKSKWMNKIKAIQSQMHTYRFLLRFNAFVFTGIRFVNIGVRSWFVYYMRRIFYFMQCPLNPPTINSFCGC